MRPSIDYVRDAVARLNGREFNRSALRMVLPEVSANRLHTALHDLVIQGEIRVVAHGGATRETAYEATEHLHPTQENLEARRYAGAFVNRLIHTWTRRRHSGGAAA